tara:strand:+ start:1079 stop:2302 length:1224 start_codon:yes stop_codon:yes gene_type:complete
MSQELKEPDIKIEELKEVSEVPSQEIPNQPTKELKPISALSSSEIELVLIQIVENIKSNKSQIIIGNKKDREESEVLELTDTMFNSLIDSLKELIHLPDPLDKVIHEKTLKSGMVARKIRVPVGTVLVKVESKPEWMASAAALSIKTGNVLHFWPEKTIQHASKAFYECIKSALEHEGINPDGIQLVDEDTDTDLVVPQGTVSFVENVKDNFSNVVAGHAGNNSIYIDDEADPYVAVESIADAKAENDDSSVENLLVHKAMAESFLPIVQNKLKDMGIVLKGCPETKEWIEVEEANEADYKKAAKNKSICVKLVENVDEAIEFINTNGNNHTETILSEKEENITKFMRNVNSSCIFKNASTRTNSAKGFGVGVGLGVATSSVLKGPIDMKALTTYKWVVDGSGQTID